MHPDSGSGSTGKEKEQKSVLFIYKNGEVRYSDNYVGKSILSMSNFQF
jgi:hypothetical protein